MQLANENLAVATKAAPHSTSQPHNLVIGTSILLKSIYTSIEEWFGGWGTDHIASRSCFTTGCTPLAGGFSQNPDCFYLTKVQPACFVSKARSVYTKHHITKAA